MDGGCLQITQLQCPYTTLIAATFIKAAPLSRRAWRGVVVVVGPWAAGRVGAAESRADSYRSQKRCRGPAKHGNTPLVFSLCRFSSFFVAAILVAPTMSLIVLIEEGFCWR